ncbi:MAG: 4-hydroxythreonine-4-phosphate dehydrogenase PdxA [Verrucomicrobiae bacterium]|nr:4-hydroxythreonine-4-phosphate dehydrogenase PdxA [Verrucomicrobiae bacterium]
MKRPASRPLRSAAAKVIGITLGDVAGIGPEVVGKALRSGQLDRDFNYEVIGESRAPRVAPGKLSTTAARFALQSLKAGVDGVRSGRYAGLVTGPVNKANLARVGFKEPGQTEWLAKKSGTRRYAMMLAGGNLRVALVSTHLALAEAIRRLSAAKIVETAELAREFLLRAGISKPRIAVAGLNPHAGEGGLFGREEIRIIAPAVRKLRRRGWDVSGPHSPDTLFHAAAGGRYDAVVCMYHDQGLIPLKLLAFETGVNVTLGLPFPRTSPDHGTAFDIAGRGVANAGSMIEALKLACVLARND